MNIGALNTSTNAMQRVNVPTKLGVDTSAYKLEDGSYVVTTKDVRFDSVPKTTIMNEEQFNEKYFPTQDSFVKKAPLLDYGYRPGVGTSSLASYDESTKRILTGFGKSRIQGTVNDKKISLDYDHRKLFKSNFEGKIGDKDISFTRKGHLGSVEYSGTYNGQEFSVKIKNGLFTGNANSISGTINNQEINLSFKKDEVPKDDALNDVISAILTANGDAANVKDGKFNGTEPAVWSLLSGKGCLFVEK